MLRPISRLLLRASLPCLCLALLAALPPLIRTHAESSAGTDSIFRNVDSSATYVGSKSCGASGGHEEINRTYAPTAHGQSMALANSPAELGRAPQPVTSSIPKAIATMWSTRTARTCFRVPMNWIRTATKPITSSTRSTMFRAARASATPIWTASESGSFRRRFPTMCGLKPGSFRPVTRQTTPASTAS